MSLSMKSLRSMAPLLAAAVGVVLMAAPLVSSVTAAPTGNRIGAIDIERTLYETPAGKRASAAFDKTRAAKQAELDKTQKDLQKAAAELEKQAPLLKPDVLAKKKGELEKRFVELQQLVVKLERDLAGERTKLIQNLLQKAAPIIEEIAKAEGVSIVVDHSAVLWADPTVDLTAKLNARMK